MFVSYMYVCMYTCSLSLVFFEPVGHTLGGVNGELSCDKGPSVAGMNC